MRRQGATWPGEVTGLFRVALPDGSLGLAAGSPERGPAALLPAEMTIDRALTAGKGGLEAALASAGNEPVPAGSRLLAPVESQEVWAAGVSYRRSRQARQEESGAAAWYQAVYEAERPELFFKAPGWRVSGPGEPVGIREDSGWDVPEPELALVLGSDFSLVGFTIGNDVSSREIEGANPLYLPQAKVYDGACALGPCLVPASVTGWRFAIRLEVVRSGSRVVAGEVSTGEMRRSFEELIGYLARCLEQPAGAVLLTGTGIVPEPGFTLREGDLVRIEIPPLGVLENPVRQVPARPFRVGCDGN